VAGILRSGKPSGAVIKGHIRIRGAADDGGETDDDEDHQILVEDDTDRNKAEANTNLKIYE